jgi:dehydrogenase/reductase SDR family member 12
MFVTGPYSLWYRWAMSITDVIDAGLELSVIASFSRVGPAIRRRLDRWRPPEPGALAGRTALVTGPTSGLGRAASIDLAGLGARVVLVGRSADRLATLRDELVDAAGEDRFPIVVADMGSLDAVRAAVARILETEPRLDVVVDNAGAIFSERSVTRDGIESTLAVLVVGPFALISGLLPLLRGTEGSRVISVTSGGMYTAGLGLDDLQLERVEYAGPRAYARAKRAQTELIREWSRRTPGTWPTFHAMHPGWADTPGLAESLPSFYGLMKPILRSPAEGAESIAWLASAPADEVARLDGRLILDRRSRPFDRAPWTRTSAQDRRQLWDLVSGLAGGPIRRA